MSPPERNPWTGEPEADDSPAPKRSRPNPWATDTTDSSGLTSGEPPWTKAPESTDSPWKPPTGASPWEADTSTKPAEKGAASSLPAGDIESAGSSRGASAEREDAREKRGEPRKGQAQKRRRGGRYGEARQAREEPSESREHEGEAPDAEGRAREICLRLLAAAPRTRAQLEDALRRKNVPDEVAEHVLGRFTDVGLIDDEAFAQAWVQSRHRGRGLGRRALAVELRRRGVANETVSEAVQGLEPEEEERTARELIARRLAATGGLDTAKRTRRLVGVLARKGYPPGLAYRVVREALEAEGADDVPEGDWDLE